MCDTLGQFANVISYKRYVSQTILILNRDILNK